MNRQDNLKPNQQPVIEDLTVDEAQSTAVKGGPIYIQVEGVKGRVTAEGHDIGF